MGITVQFTSGSIASGLMCNAFIRENVGTGLFFKFTETAPVSGGDVAKFSTISVPGEYAFRVDSAAGTRWRSGPLLMEGANVTNTYWVLDAGTISFTPAQLSGMLPTPPLTADKAIITSIVLTLGTGTITATGAGLTVITGFGVIPFTYTYVFTLDADDDPANYQWPNGVPPAITVRTISLVVVGATGGVLGFLVNSLVGVLFNLIASTIQQSIERVVQTSIDTAVADALAAQKAPAGTIATAESVTILADGISIRVFAGIDLTKACASTPSGGSVKVRSPEQLHHLRTIRDRVLRHSPQGLAYIDLFEKFSPELVRILLSDEDLLKRVDDLVSRLLVSFPLDNPEAGRLPQELANTLVDIMDVVAASVSPELAMTIKALRDEVFTFVDRPAEEVLAESLKLVQ
jgi:hypothetical protein